MQPSDDRSERQDGQQPVLREVEEGISRSFKKPRTKSPPANFELNLLTLNAIKNDREKLESFLTQTDEAIMAAADQRLVNLMELTKLWLAKLDSYSAVFTNTPIMEIHSIPERVEDIVEGNVFEINRYENRRAKPVALYIRKHLVDQFQSVTSFMNNKSKQKLTVTGPPGCGKTCFFWMWACMLMKQNMRVLFIQYRVVSSCHIWILENGTTKLLTSPVVDSENLSNVLRDVLDGRAKKFDVCICDRVRLGIPSCDLLLGVLHPRTREHPTLGKISKLIMVTSLPFNRSPGERIDAGNFADISFDSWQEEDYEKAALVQNARTRTILLEDWRFLTGKTATEADDHNRDEDERILEAAKQKYHYAGGCATYMFDESIEELKEILEIQFRRVPKWSMFTSTSMSVAASESSVNCLMQQFSSGEKTKLMCAPVSKYVLLRAYAACRDKLTKALDAVAKATNNQSLKGWAFELKQKDAIYSALEANRGRSPFQIATSSVVKNDKMTLVPKFEANFDGSMIAEDQVKSGTVIWCSDNFQGTFDAAFYCGKTLVTIKFTVSKKHELNLENMSSLRRALLQKMAKVDMVIHMGVVENDSSDHFDFDFPTGYAARTRSNAGTFQVHVDHAGELVKADLFVLLGGRSAVQPNGQTHCVSIK